MATSPAFLPHARLQSKAGICAYLGGISAATYDAYEAKGIVPGKVRGTNLYDRKQHDHALDVIAGLAPVAGATKASPFEEWEAANAA